MSYHLVPTFLKGSKGQIFNLHFKPTSVGEGKTCVIIAPAFEEEMNRCRYMCNMLAQGLAEGGVATMMSDPFGTGDSAGEFRDLNWQQLGEDLLTTVEHAKAEGYEQLVLLGIRLGALTVSEIAAKSEHIHKVVFWQPVVNGKVALTQLLRIRIAASLGRDEEGGSVKEFEQMSADGKIVEVSGYELSPDLFTGIQSAKLDDAMSQLDVPVEWFTAVASAERKPPRAELSAIAKWQEKGKSISHNVVVGPPYWQVHERTLAPELVKQTVAVLTGRQDAN